MTEPPAGAPLYDPSEHRPLADVTWSEAQARTSIEAIADETIDAYGGPDLLWPNHPAELEGERDVPYRNAYFGAAGVAWALETLNRAGLGPELSGMAELMATLPRAFRDAPELTRLATPPAPSLLFGESGILLASEAVLVNGKHLDELESCIRGNTRHPSLELCWGSPGTMTAALELWRRTGEPRWREAWLGSADWLLAQWQDPVWTQDLYGESRPYTGAGHGFAGTASVLLEGRDLLGERAAEVVDRIARVLAELAIEDGDLAQWDPVAGADSKRRPVQWCHGAPGIITSLAELPADEVTDRLLAAGGELTWSAGPLRKGVGLCHGTAGNAYALLSLYGRSGEERWLDRARLFAMDAVQEISRRRAAGDPPRYTLFTGDLGVALLLRSCLTLSPGFPS